MYAQTERPSRKPTLVTVPEIPFLAKPAFVDGGAFKSQKTLDDFYDSNIEILQARLNRPSGPSVPNIQATQKDAAIAPVQKFSIFPATRIRVAKPDDSEISFWSKNPIAKTHDWRYAYLPLASKNQASWVSQVKAVGQVAWDGVAGGIALGLALGLTLANRPDLAIGVLDQHAIQLASFMGCAALGAAALFTVGAYSMGGWWAVLVAQLLMACPFVFAAV